MSDIAIRVEGLSKQYRIGGAQASYQTFREALINASSSPMRWLRGERREENTIWALDDVSFEVKHGEAVGIIGRNGAGKSTLLKVLSRITKPTRGRVDLYGRVGSLLEVGTGFHPELTGRENIFLNGAILGMKRREIEQKFDEIVDFAEIERFLDTPVKHYSSGMYVRLAFAVAAHLEPEILLVDEVLAVGDAAFQKKCLGKMGEVAKQGRTVLFVSHNMVAMQSLCSYAVWFNQGHIEGEGPPSKVINDYQNSYSTYSCTERFWGDISTAPGNKKIRIRHVFVRPVDGDPSRSPAIDEVVEIGVEFWSLMHEQKLGIALQIVTPEGIVAFTTSTNHHRSLQGKQILEGLHFANCRIDENLLNNGQYRVRLLVVEDQNRIIYKMEDVLLFEMSDSANRRGAYFGKREGVVAPLLSWSLDHKDGK